MFYISETYGGGFYVLHKEVSVCITIRYQLC